MILGHVQQELTVEDLQAVLLPSPSEQQESDEPTSTVTTPVRIAKITANIP